LLFFFQTQNKKKDYVSFSYSLFFFSLSHLFKPFFFFPLYGFTFPIFCSFFFLPTLMPISLPFFSSLSFFSSGFYTKTKNKTKKKYFVTQTNKKKRSFEKKIFLL